MKKFWVLILIFLFHETYLQNDGSKIACVGDLGDMQGKNVKIFRNVIDNQMNL